MAMPQSAFPSELPPRQTSLKDRACPNIRGCWSFSWHAYDLKTSDKAVFMRRLCMLAILGMRTTISVLAIVFYHRLDSMIINAILGVIGFFFIAWCLATIGEATGQRKVLGMMISRWHFDIFLILCALVHAGILVGVFFAHRSVYTGLWYLMWLLVFGAAWIATWTPDLQSNV